MQPHQDATYLHTDPITITGFWIPTEDATLENGCLWYIKGSHKNGLHSRYVIFLENMSKTVNEFMQFFILYLFSFVRNPNSNSNDLLIYDKPEPKYDQSLFTPVEVKRGSLVLIHGLVVHQSEWNRSDKSRFAYTFHVMESDNVKYSSDNWLQLPFGEHFVELY